MYLLVTVISFTDGKSTSSQSSCSSSCFCDEDGSYVSCIGDSIWDFDATTIPHSAVRLEIRNYNIGTLSSIHLDQTNQLEELKLQQTKIDSIANGTFDKLNKLNRLDLSQNEIEILNAFTFQGLHNCLKYLDLSSNHLSEIDEAFLQLTNLEQLNLRSNRLCNLTINTFLGLVKLQYLNLDLNNIKSIQVGSFIHLPHLAHLILSNNPFNQLSRIDSFGSTLQFIDISNVTLTNIPSGFPHFVRNWKLIKNNITSIMVEDFDGYPYLNSLVLDENKIDFIETDAFGRLQLLTKLWLNKNNLKEMPIDLPLSLKELSIEENQIKKIAQPSLQGLLNLERLSLRTNQIELIQTKVFSDLINLESLDLSDNKIENLTSELFLNLTKLEILNLSKNNIRQLESGCFIDLNGLKALHLSQITTHVVIAENAFEPFNNIETLEILNSSFLADEILSSNRLLQSLSSLQEINIMQNGLVNLPIDFGTIFPRLKAIKMNGNNWHCNDQILWLAKWIRTANIQFHTSYSIKCWSPAYLKNKLIASLTENDFRTSQSTNINTNTTINRIIIAQKQNQSTNDSAIKYAIPKSEFRFNDPIQNKNQLNSVNKLKEKLQQEKEQMASENGKEDSIRELNLRTEKPKLINALIKPNLHLTTINSVPNSDGNFNLNDHLITDLTTTTNSNLFQSITRQFQEPIQVPNSSKDSSINISVSNVTTELPVSAGTGSSNHKLVLPMYTIMSKRERERHGVHDNFQVTKYHQTISPKPFVHHNNKNFVIHNDKSVHEKNYHSSSFLVKLSFLSIVIIVTLTIGFSYLYFLKKRKLILCSSHFISPRCGHMTKEIQYSSKNDQISILSSSDDINLKDDNFPSLTTKLLFPVSNMDITKYTFSNVNDHKLQEPLTSNSRHTQDNHNDHSIQFKW